MEWSAFTMQAARLNIGTTTAIEGKGGKMGLDDTATQDNVVVLPKKEDSESQGFRYRAINIRLR